MIKFFRKIRQNLLVEGKTRKYLTYAAGEIILVVFGILIALSINNLNDKIRDKESENQYYCRILDDFELDKKQIAELEAQASNRISVSKEILRDLDAKAKDKHYILNRFLTAIRSDNYVPRNVTFKDLISSGNLNLLKDIKIKNTLIQYYSDLENKQSQLNQYRSEKVKQTFEIVNSSLEFGSQEFEYIYEILGPEIIETLPNYDWTKEKDSEYYKKFQLTLVFNIAMADREKQNFSAIKALMETPYQLINRKCKGE